MKSLKYWLLLTIFLYLATTLYGENPFKIKPSINYYRDLSDTYGGGGLLNGEVGINKLWFGISLSFGHFQSQYTFFFKVPITETNSILEIPIEEMSIMQITTASAVITPIQKKWISSEILFGICYNFSKSLFIKDVEYSYNIDEKRFTYLLKDYQLAKKNNLGYQIGLNISFYFSDKVGLQLSARMQDLNKGGSFFFLGGGLCFKL
jgi:hypothetical protein